jgi:hypothetical protein
MTLDKKRMEALAKLFDHFAVKDQQSYYEHTIENYLAAAQQIGRGRAVCSLLAGLGAALAGLIVQSVFVSGGRCTVSPVQVADQGYCGLMGLLITISAIIAVIAPALGGALNTLSDLYQWDRLISIYKNAVESLAVADAYSPDPEMDDMTYRASLNAFGEGTLSVMDREAAQWGQLIRTPEQIETFLAAERKKAEDLKIPGTDKPLPPS